MRWKVLFVCVLVVVATALIGSLFTSGSADSWYVERKPSFAPPDAVFGPVWTVLYGLIAVVLYRAWVYARSSERRRRVAAVFGVNLVANAAWSGLFFGLHWPLLALLDLLVIFSSIVAMMMVVRKDRVAVWMLVPYLVWVAFAGFLNAAFL